MARERFRRRGRSAEDVRRKAAEGSRDYDQLFVGDVKRWKPADGENIIRIMPATFGFQPYIDKELDAMSDEELEKLQAEEDAHGDGWDLPVYVHYGVGPDNGSYLCLDKMKGERCPVCEAKAAADDPDEADALSPNKRALVWLIDRNAEKEGPQTWSMPWSKVRNEIYARSVDKKHGTPILIDDADEGFDVIFNKSGKEMRTQYTGVEIDRDPTPLHEDEAKQDRWLAYTMDNRLPDILNYYPAEHIEKVLFGRKSSRREDGDDDGDEGGADERSTRRGRGSPRRGRSSEPPEERDYRDAGGDAEPGDEPARPRRGSRSEDPESGPEEGTSARRSRRSRSSEPPEEPDADPGPGEDASPTEQARSRLGGLRSRRTRDRS